MKPSERIRRMAQETVNARDGGNSASLFSHVTTQDMVKAIMGYLDEQAEAASNVAQTGQENPGVGQVAKAAKPQSVNVTGPGKPGH